MQPYKQVLVLDFETYWDSHTYTLTKMTTEQYIRDSRFRAHGLAWRWVDKDDVFTWVSNENIPAFIASIAWDQTAVLAHNAQFDVGILSWRYGAKPAFIFDTLSMARALRGVEVGNSLAKLAEEFGLPPKGKELVNSDGVEVLSAEQEQQLAGYCKHDAFLCLEIFKRLADGYPTSELRLIDMTLKMFTNPVLTLDKHMLVEAIHAEKESREALLVRLGLDDAMLASNEKFAQTLQSLGITPPTKISKTTKKEAYAFAKNDALFQALVNSDREEVALLCEARMAVKSTLERTRAQRFLDIAQRGTLPVPLSYYGAHTGRWAASKGSGLNMQNLKRGSFLRRAIGAPDGYVLAVADLSQIEPRVLAWLADYRDLINIFHKGGDPYASFGAQMFGIPGMTKDSHPALRQSAKSALLGAGYGLGWASFSAQLLTGFLGAPPILYDKKFAKQLGVTGQIVANFMEYVPNMEKVADIPRTCTSDEILIHAIAAKQIIDKYRAAAQPVVEFWQLCDAMIHSSLVNGREFKHKCLGFQKEAVVLPNGMKLRYPDLSGKPDEKGRVQWTYGNGKKLYGGKLTENIVQSVARCVMTDGMLRIQKRYPCVLTVHDEVAALVPEAEGEEAYNWMLTQMTLEPKYLPGIPLAADGGFAKRYGDAKK